MNFVRNVKPYAGCLRPFSVTTMTMSVVMSFASNLKSNDDDNAVLQYYMYLIFQSVLDG